MGYVARKGKDEMSYADISQILIDHSTRSN